MYTRTIELDVTMEASDAHILIGGVRGRLLGVQYVQHPTNPFGTSTDHMLTGQTTARVLMVKANQQASFFYRSRRPCHGIDGAALYYNDEGDEPVVDAPAIGGEELYLFIHSAGTGKQGTYRLFVEGG